MARPTEGQASGKVGAKVLFIARQQDEVVGAYPSEARWGAGLGLGTEPRWGAGLGADMVAGPDDGLCSSHRSQAGLMESQQEK